MRACLPELANAVFIAPNKAAGKGKVLYVPIVGPQTGERREELKLSKGKILEVPEAVWSGCWAITQQRPSSVLLTSN